MNISQILYFFCVDHLGASSASVITIYANANYFCFLNNLLVDRYISFLFFSFFIFPGFLLPVCILPMKSSYSGEFTIVKMWQQFKGCFQLLYTTNSTRQGHLAEINFQIKNNKSRNNFLRHKHQLRILHLDHIIISTKLLS